MIYVYYLNQVRSKYMSLRYTVLLTQTVLRHVDSNSALTGG